ncbi:MAG: cyclic nucleotide-binding domain-containing protein [Chloroflexi bacterium]|nr:cyclic nucleotide-binding domain-containing protein [Chloroflexota bacterium]
MNLETALRTAPLFAPLDERQRSRIGDLMTIRRFDPGTTILRQGTSAVALYLILDGQVDVSREPEEGGKAVILARLDEGDIFGEMAVLDDDTRSSSVVAVTPVRCALLSRWELIQELRRYPELSIELIRVLARRIRILDERLASLTARDATSTLA